MMRHLVWTLLFLTSCGQIPAAEMDPDAAVAGPQVLTVSVTGGGAVTSNPAGIDCGSKCSSEFAPLTPVTLSAAPDSSSAFVGWTGDCAGTSTCALTMNGAKTATARFAMHGAKRWLAQVSFSGQDTMEELAVDPQGNVLAAGTIDDGGGTDLFVIKYGKEDGKVLWMQQFDTATGEDLGGLATDAAGNVYLAARLSGLGTTATFGTQTVTGDLFGNIVVLRLAGDTGAVVWAKQWGGTAQDIPEALAVSGGDLYVVGYSSSNPSTFDGKSFAGSTGNGFIVRASTATGIAAELKPVVGSVDLFSVAVNGAHIAVAGQVRSAVTVDSCGLSPSGAGNDGMILDLLGSTLACQWGKNFGDSVSNNDATVHSVAAFPTGGWVVSGSFKGNILLAASGSSLASRGGFDVFTGRFASNGTHLWSFRYGDTGFDIGYGITTTREGNVILAGVFDTTATFGGITVTGANNTFVTRMSSTLTPTHEWAVSLGGNDTDLTESVAAAPDGSVYVLSSFTGMTSVGGTALSSQGYDAWIGALVR